MTLFPENRMEVGCDEMVMTSNQAAYEMGPEIGKWKKK